MGSMVKSHTGVLWGSQGEAGGQAGGNGFPEEVTLES